MTTILGPVVAGTFYPGDPEGLERTVRRLLAAADREAVPEPLRALVVPHAGYVYSGPVAATAYATLPGRRYERIVLVGPSHYVRFPGLATPGVDGWATPLGVVRLEAPPAHPDVDVLPEAFAREHCLEVQLPFLQQVLPDIPVLPLLTGDTTDASTAAVLEELVTGSTLLVVSSDLSHYLPHDAAVAADWVTVRAVLDRRPEALTWESACGRIGIQAALRLARARGWRVALLDRRTSGDTAGDRTRVVGYAAFALG